MERTLSGREPRGNYDRLMRLAEAMEHTPRVWGVVSREHDRRTAQVVYRDAAGGRTAAFNKPGFQFELKQTGHKWTVWGRYLPPQGEA